MKTIILSIINFYQGFISPYLGKNCRFYPSCSEYSHQAIEKHGVVKGSFRALGRIFRCQPFHQGGVDLL